jgi:hypothetical protein
MMARIFYFTKDGSIYGVHPEPHEGNPKIRLPAGVAWIDVPEQPHEIAWPQSDGQAGTEQMSLVINGRLRAKVRAPQDKRAQLEKMLRAHDLTVADLKSILQE